MIPVFPFHCVVYSSFTFFGSISSQNDQKEVCFSVFLPLERLSAVNRSRYTAFLFYLFSSRRDRDCCAVGCCNLGFSVELNVPFFCMEVYVSA